MAHELTTTRNASRSRYHGFCECGWKRRNVHTGGELADLHAAHVAGYDVKSLKPAPTSRMELVGEHPSPLAHIVYRLESGGVFTGTVPEINALLLATGYARIAVRRNLMPPRAAFIEALGTPIYCSPASESYWSM